MLISVVAVPLVTLLLWSVDIGSAVVGLNPRANAVAVRADRDLVADRNCLVRWPTHALCFLGSDQPLPRTAFSTVTQSITHDAVPLLGRLLGRSAGVIGDIVDGLVGSLMTCRLIVGLPLLWIVAMTAILPALAIGVLGVGPARAGVIVIRACLRLLWRIICRILGCLRQGTLTRASINGARPGDTPDGRGRGPPPPPPPPTRRHVPCGTFRRALPQDSPPPSPNRSSPGSERGWWDDQDDDARGPGGHDASGEVVDDCVTTTSRPGDVEGHGGHADCDEVVDDRATMTGHPGDETDDVVSVAATEPLPSALSAALDGITAATTAALSASVWVGPVVRPGGCRYGCGDGRALTARDAGVAVICAACAAPWHRACVTRSVRRMSAAERARYAPPETAGIPWFCVDCHEAGAARRFCAGCSARPGWNPPTRSGRAAVRGSDDDDAVDLRDDRRVRCACGLQWCLSCARVRPADFSALRRGLSTWSCDVCVGAPGSVCFVPALHAAAHQRDPVGYPLLGADAQAVSGAARAYTAWRDDHPRDHSGENSPGTPPSWDELIGAVQMLLGDDAVLPGYIPPAIQERVLRIRRGTVCSHVWALGAWASVVCGGPVAAAVVRAPPRYCSCCRAVGTTIRGCGTSHSCLRTVAGLHCRKSADALGRSLCDAALGDPPAGGLPPVGTVSDALDMEAGASAGDDRVLIDGTYPAQVPPPPVAALPRIAYTFDNTASHLISLPPAAVVVVAHAGARATVPFVPKATVSRWSRLLLRWLIDYRWRQEASARDGSTMPSYPAFLIGPLLVFRAPATKKDIDDRIAAAERDDWCGLARLVEHQRPTGASHRRQTDDEARRAAVRRAQFLVAHGSVSRGIAALDRIGGPPSPDQSTLDCLRALYPAECDIRPGGECLRSLPAGGGNEGQRVAAPGVTRGATEVPSVAWSTFVAGNPPPDAANPPEVSEPDVVGDDGMVRDATAPSAARSVSVVGCLPPDVVSDVRREIQARAAVVRRAQSRPAQALGDDLTGPRDALPAEDDPAAAAGSWQRAVQKALSCCGRLSAPGLSGLRAEHVRAALCYRPLSGAVSDALASVVDGVCSGAVSAGLRSCRLFGIPKPSGPGVRPIGIGELLRNLACRVTLPLIVATLEPGAAAAGQLGMSTAGTQRGAARVHGMLRRGWLVCSIDVTNAFNAFSRAEILRHLPAGLVGHALIRALYGCGPTAMHVPGFVDAVIPCDRGVIQGCVLAAALFASALVRGPVAAARADVDGCVAPAAPTQTPGVPGSDALPLPAAPGAAGAPDVADVWFADDGHVGCPPDSVPLLEEYMSALEIRLRDVGLRVAVGPRKTAVVAPAGFDLPEGGWLSRHATSVDALHCLGVPAGRFDEAGERAATAMTLAVFQKAANVVTGLARLEHPQHILTCLRLGGTWSRVAFLAAMTPYAPLAVDSACLTCEAADAGVLSHALGPFGANLGADAWRHAGLPLRLGGLGILRPSEERITAPGHMAQVCAAADAGNPAALTRARADLHKVRESRGRATFAELLERARSAADRVRLLETAADAGASGGWLGVPANRDYGTLMDSATASTALALRLGLPVTVLPPLASDAAPLPRDAAEFGRRCPAGCAHRARLDPFGRHALGCTATLVPRHNLVRDTIAAALAPLGRTRVAVEVGCGPDGTPVPGGRGVARPGDVAFRLPGDAYWTYLDVGVQSVTEAVLPRAVEDARALPQSIFDRKRAAIAPDVLRTGAAYFPVAAGPLGLLDRRSVAPLRAAAAAVDARDLYSPLPGAPSHQRRMMLAVSCAVAAGGATGVVAIRAAGCLSASPAALSAESARLLVLNAHSCVTDGPAGSRAGARSEAAGDSGAVTGGLMMLAPSGGSSVARGVLGFGPVPAGGLGLAARLPCPAGNRMAAPAAVPRGRRGVVASSTIGDGDVDLNHAPVRRTRRPTLRAGGG